MGVEVVVGIVVVVVVAVVVSGVVVVGGGGGGGVGGCGGVSCTVAKWIRKCQHADANSGLQSTSCK